MVRRRCCGLVDELPCSQKFAPTKIGDGEEMVIHIEETEAIRLKDLLGLEQEECARQMGLTRQTFQRILKSARSKLALAITEGRSISIEGGNYMLKNRVFECRDCSHRWEVEPCSEGGKHGYEIACPKCGSMNKTKISEDGTKHQCGGVMHQHQHQHQHGHGGCCGK